MLIHACVRLTKLQIWILFIINISHHKYKALIHKGVFTVYYKTMTHTGYFKGRICSGIVQENDLRRNTMPRLELHTCEIRRRRSMIARYKIACRLLIPDSLGQAEHLRLAQYWVFLITSHLTEDGIHNKI